MIDKKLHGKIISALRKMTFAHKPRNEAFKRAQVAPATHECEKCGKYCYNGKSQKNYDKLVAEFPDKEVMFKMAKADHKITIMPLRHWTWDWNLYIERMFPETPEEYQILCSPCDKVKTDEEKAIRAKLRKEKKLLDLE